MEEQDDVALLKREDAFSSAKPGKTTHPFIAHLLAIVDYFFYISASPVVRSKGNSFVSLDPDQIPAATATLAAVIASAKTPRAALFATLRAFLPGMLAPGLAKLVGDLAAVVQLLLFHNFLTNMSGLRDPLLMALASIVQTLALHVHHARVIRAGARARTAVVTILTNHIFKRGGHTLVQAGSVAPLLTRDAERIEFLFWYFHYFWAAPLQIILVVTALYFQIGAGALVGAGALLALMGIGSAIATALVKVKSKLSLVTEARAGSIVETLRAWLFVKSHGAEEDALHKLATLRASETKGNLKSGLLTSISNATMQAGSTIVALTAFAATSLIHGDPLTPASIFSSLALFSLLRVPLLVISYAFGAAANAIVAFKSIHPLLSLPPPRTLNPPPPPVVVQFTSATVSYPNTPPVLKAVTISVNKGELVAVVGPTGAGKSCLLAAIVGVAEVGGGGMQVADEAIGFCSQTAFLQNATLRENVAAFYRGDDDVDERGAIIDNALRATALDEDVAEMGGLDRRIGEGGVELSGGQRARVALARAVASRAPVVVLDDPFASLDPVVAARVLRSAICDALGGSTRIVASNFPPLLRTANRVFVVANGCVVEAAVDDAMLQSLSPPPVSAIPSSPPPPPPVPSPSAAGSQGGAEETPGVEMKGGGLYAAYVRRGGGAVFVVASLVVLLNAAMVGADLILTNWSNFKEPLIFYGVSCAAVVLLSFLLSIAWLWAGLRVANAIHKSLARKVIYARASFLSRTSMGYLINRFVSDIPTLDVPLPARFASYVAQISRLVFSVGLIAAMAPPVAAPFALLIFPFIKLHKLFLPPSHALRAALLSAQTPFLNSVCEGISGAHAIVAARCEESLVLRLQEEYIRMLRPYWSTHLLNRLDVVFRFFLTTRRWLGIRLELLGAALVRAIPLLKININA